MAAEAKLVEEWKRRILWATNKYNAEFKDIIDTNLRYFRGVHYPTLTAEERAGWDLMVVNKVFSNIKTILPAINLRNPKVIIKPRRKKYIQPDGTPVDGTFRAKLVEIVLNYYVKELDLRAEAKRVLLDALIMPWGIMKLGYMPAFEKISTSGDLLDVRDMVKPALPFWCRWSPRYFRMDPEADRIENANWVAFRRLADIDDIKANPALKVPKDLRPTVNIKAEWGTRADGSRSHLTEGLYERVGIWEIWDKKKQELIEIADSSSKALRHDDWPYKLDGFPCALLFFNINPDEQMPIADVTTYLPQQDELNRIETLMVEHVKRHLPVIVNAGITDPAEQDKLLKGLVAKVINAVGVPDARAALAVVQGAQLSPDIHAVRKMLASDLDEISSVTELERGTAARVDTATEAAILQAATTLRRSDRQADLEAFYREVVRIFRQILQQTMGPVDIFMGQDELSKILGPDAQGLSDWLSISRDDIAGEFSEDIEVGSSLPINEAVRKQNALEKLQVLRADPTVKQRELIKRYLEAMDEPDIDGLLLTDDQIMQLGQNMAGMGGAPQGPPPSGGGGQSGGRSLPKRMGVGGGGLQNALMRGG